VDCYLLYFRLQLITHLLSALLSFQLLFTKSSCGDQQLATPSPFSSALTESYPFCCMFIFSSLFVVQFFVFCVFGFFCVCGIRDQSVQVATLVYPRGDYGNTM
jgi:hypothetical protein